MGMHSPNAYIRVRACVCLFSKSCRQHYMQNTEHCIFFSSIKRNTCATGLEPSSRNCPPNSRVRYIACLIRCTPFCGTILVMQPTYSIKYERLLGLDAHSQRK